MAPSPMGESPKKYGELEGVHRNGTNGSGLSPAPPPVPYLRPDAPDHGRFVTEEEYWATFYEHPDASYEWNGGYLEAKPMPTPPQYKLFLWFVALLHEYNERLDIGLLMGLETGFTMTVPNLTLPGRLKKTVRKPDVALVRHDNPVPWGMDERSYKGICDLCVEVLSDSHQVEIDRDVKEKLIEYEFAGVQEYYILDEKHRYTKFYQRNAAGKYVEIQPDRQGIIRSTVLPGFQFRQRDMRSRPSLETLAKDPAYQGYVLLEYQKSLLQAAAAQQRAVAEQQRADAEQQRADTEQQRADTEQQRADTEQQRADAEQQRADAEQQRADALDAELQQARADLAKLRQP